MKKAFKLFGFIALSMTLAVACGNANNTPAEEEVVAEETVEATEQVVEEVAAPVAQPQATCDEKKDAVKEMTKEEVEKAEKIERNKAKFDNQKNLVGATVESADEAKKSERIEKSKEKLEASKKGGVMKAN